MIEEDGATYVERQRQPQSEEANSVLLRGDVNDNVSGGAGLVLLSARTRAGMNESYSRLRSIFHDFKRSLDIGGLVARVRGSDVADLDRSSQDAAVPLLDLLAQHREVPKLSAALGLSEQGSTIFHDFSSPDTPHLLVVGGHDAGKTVMLRSIAASLAFHNRQSIIQLAAISPVMADKERQQIQAAAWYPLNYLPHMLCDVAVRHSEIVELLAFLSQEIAYREEHSFAVPRLIVLIDQADVLLTRGGPQCAEPIVTMAEKGESVGIHLVLSTGSIDSAIFGTQLMKKMATRLIGRPDTGMPDQEPVYRQNDAGQLLGEGDFLYRQGNRILRLQGSYIDDYDLYLKLTEMARHRAILLAQPAETRPRIEQPEHQAPPVLWPTKNGDKVLAALN